MPSKKSKQSPSPIIRDIPRCGFTCRSYLDGHNVHYIPVGQLVPGLVAVDARLQCEGGGITLVIGQERTTVFTHNPAGIELLVAQLGPSCQWYPTLRLACWPRADERHWASLALAPVDRCASADEAHLAELRLWS